MPTYSLNHVHHETKDVSEAVAWYQKVFGATAGEPFVRGGANWVFVHIGEVQVTVTDREFSDMELGRYQGLDHFALNTSDFDATLAHLEKEGIPIWFGPVALEDGSRIVFINGPDNIKIELME
ncbi:MAG: hypothetical protein GKR89_13020 [Candidatus Latescibacteria bacterium]|nr:hypothetical protein [Candidatus Latescibacterota bacterium]